MCSMARSMVDDWPVTCAQVLGEKVAKLYVKVSGSDSVSLCAHPERCKAVSGRHDVVPVSVCNVYLP